MRWHKQKCHSYVNDYGIKLVMTHRHKYRKSICARPFYEGEMTEPMVSSEPNHPGGKWKEPGSTQQVESETDRCGTDRKWRHLGRTRTRRAKDGPWGQGRWADSCWLPAQHPSLLPGFPLRICPFPHSICRAQGLAKISPCDWTYFN